MKVIAFFMLILVASVCSAGAQERQPSSSIAPSRAAPYLPSDLNSAELLKRKEEEIAKLIDEINLHPKITYISPNTRIVGYAMYYDNVKTKIEKYGTLHFPQSDGKKLYGKLIVSIPIYQDGSIYKDGPKVEKSSGNEKLDNAALAIVHRSAPFGSFPKGMLTAGGEDVWVLFFPFNFIHEEDSAPVVEEPEPSPSQILR